MAAVLMAAVLMTAYLTEGSVGIEVNSHREKGFRPGVWDHELKGACAVAAVYDVNGPQHYRLACIIMPVPIHLQCSIILL